MFPVRSPSSRRASGFTLAELMIVVAITGILAALAAPSFNQWMENERARGAATDIFIALSKARSEAIKRNTSVTLAPKSGGWATGWQIADPASSSNLIEDHGALRGGVSLALTPSGLTGIVYRSSGRVSASSNPGFDISGSYANSTRCVCLDLSGRPTIKSGACSSSC